MQGLRPAGPAASGRAYVTLVTNADYALGARALLRSIALTGTTADRVVLHTPAVAPAARGRRSWRPEGRPRRR